MARSVNKVTLVGNLGKEPEVRYTADGKAVATFSLATSRSRRDQSGGWTDETEWHRIVAFERNAETASQYLHKGHKVYIDGRIQSRKYTDNQGIERTVYEIVANDLVQLERRDAMAGGGDGDDWEQAPAPQQRQPQRPQAAQAQAQPARPQRQAPAQPQRPAPAEDETFASDDMDDVPF